MIDFVEYVVSELKRKQLSKADALALIRQYARQPAATGATALLHPLLHRNISDLDQLGYGSTFSGEEFFLDDHRVQGRKVLPGVAYLEMARAAVALALPDRAADTGMELRNVVWAQPLVVADPRQVVLALFAHERGGDGREQVDFELYSDEDSVHFQGRATLGPAAAPSRHDLDAMRARMNGAGMDAAELYAAIAAMGVDLGPAQQGVVSLQRGDGELLVRIRRPDALDTGSEAYTLHPSVMDSAVQAGMALVMARSRGDAPALPFALDTLRIHAACAKDMLAWVRYAPGSRDDDRVIKLDIDLCDSDGRVCVQMLGFSSRVLADARASQDVSDDNDACLLAERVWEPSEPVAATSAGDEAAFAQRHLLLLDGPQLQAAQWQAGRAHGQCLRLHSGGERSAAEVYAQLSLSCFEQVRAILSDKPGGRVLVQVAIATDASGEARECLHAGVSGLLRTAAQENPRMCAQVLLVAADIQADGLVRLLDAEAAAGGADALVRYTDGRREVARWRELATPAATPSFKKHGVYLISGGLGGLGRVFARAILAQTAHAQVILAGRAAWDDARRAALDAVLAELTDDVRATAAPRLHYRELDLADAAQVAAVVAGVGADFGRLDGIVHSAGMIQDEFIVKKPSEQFARVLEPKVAGTWHLDLASRAFDLDFFALFSSGVSAFGNAGQADYAAANGFLDGFAAYRNGLVESGQRRGRSVSIQWPLWRDGGMAPHAAQQAALRQSIGMSAMPSDEGLRAFHASLSLPCDQVLVVRGDAARLRRSLFDPAPERGEPVARAAPAGAGFDAEALAALTGEFLRKEFSQVLRLAAHKIDPQAPLEKYGIDSILAMDLTAQLEHSFGSLPKTLFFEYQTIAELAGYFVRDYAARLTALLAPSSQPAAPAPVRIAAPMAAATTAPTLAGKRPRRRERAAASAAASAGATTPSAEPIAIVGLSGRYPESPDLNAYWRNLRDGRDCIVEIPRERWDWRDYYSEDRSAEGRHFSRWGGFIDGVDEFDPLFFNIPPAGAELIDPQERLFLQHAWMAVEDAGYTRAGLQAVPGQDAAAQVGVYVGVMYGEYQLFGAQASLRGQRMGLPQSYASIANRVSYVLNLHGPSMTLDTMCSSSLTAIHLACQDLKLGRTGLAIAGGVNVTIHPNKYLILSAGQFISSDGHCQSFGEGGDGYIPGEGVGAVVLKRLSDAQRDGNHIYGVIRGSALNHGGKTNGYSVPNPKAQSSAIALALKEAGTDARRIGYIEAHGTGTKLGDPIEIAALTQVFRQYTQDRQFCAIGSAKSNIGHCESAAGIAGLSKVLLQMRHGMIAPSLHSATLNPHIDFERSPFVVNQRLREWPAPRIDGRDYPRIAGISSFGAGGSNAHLIVEDYPQPIQAPPGSGAAVVPLSARTAAQLRQKARDLAAFADDTGADLDAIAYTLQTGREAMDHRLALVVDSLPRLAQRLRAFADGESGIEGCFHGQIEHERDGIAALGQDEDMREAIDKWIARGKLSKLAELWVQGLQPDWRKLHGPSRPMLAGLPAYPFARERYWVAAAGAEAPAIATAAARLHPLLHANTSDFHQLSYRSDFSGEEAWLADHRVDLGAGPRKLLPAVACLEMVRAAIDLALPADGAARVVELRNTAWTRPIAVDSATAVSLALWPAGEGSIDFELAGEDEVHCQGQARIDRGAIEVAALDPAALRARMSGAAIAPQRLYARFDAMGIRYGASMRGIAALYGGDGELLADLRLPAQAQADAADYRLHPSLLDSALQAAIGLAGDLDPGADAPSVPFALDSLRVFAACAPRLWAWVRYAPGGAPREGLVKIDIDLCDEAGRVCVQMRGLVSRGLSASAVADLARTPAEEGTCLIARSQWEALPQAASPGAPARQVLLYGLPALDPARLRARIDGVEVETVPLDDAADLAAGYRQAALDCFGRLQTALRQPSQAPALWQVVIADTGEDSLLAGLSGLIDTARLEQPQWRGQLLLIDPAADSDRVAAHLATAAAHPHETLLRFGRDDEAASALRWNAEPMQTAAPSAFKDDGVYLISGGLGALGLLFAGDILARTDAAVVVLGGRGEADALTAAQRDAMSEVCAQAAVSPSRLVYRRLDPADGDQVQAAVAAVVAEFGALDGVLHSAGTTCDGLIAGKHSDEFARVLTPKLEGSVHLDRATRDLALDFFVLFSSVSAAMGNPGQADYAAANGFMDRFAAYRNGLVARGQRHGRSLSIGWPLWRDGGMQVDARTREWMREASGMTPLRSESGLRALHEALALGLDRVLVIEGEPERLRHALRHRHAPQAMEATIASPPTTLVHGDEADGERLIAPVLDYLRGEFSTLLGVARHDIDAKAPLERYGIDSVLTMKLTAQLERRFGSLSKTLLFEHRTLASLAAYLAAAFPAVAADIAGTRPVAVEAAPLAPAALPVPAMTRAPLRERGRFLAAAAAPERGEDVAIVGVAGRYPHADHLGEFWDNLKHGRDCIGEIPAERWDHARYFDPARNRPGKSYSKWGGFLSGVDRFDPLFFSISPKEAELIDPQERLFLETVWETLEDAGYAKDGLAGRRVGVYVGAMWGQYELYGASAPAAGIPSSSFASIANRVSYFFDFNGPSLALDTMCSSSLTAIHLASEDVRKGAIDVAIAGGVNVSVHPSKYLSLSQGNFASSDGRCRSFGAGGDGYVPGEGVGAVMLKPLTRALADGDQIYAVIKAGAINHGGKTNGYTVPNPLAHAELIAQTLAAAGIAADTLGYIETHGTGTSLGDPIEISGLAKAFAASGEAVPSQSCPIGSVKSNIGHLESAAGIAAVSKVLLQFKHRQRAPSLHALPANPNIDFAATPFYVQTALSDWPAPATHPRRAGISSFGAGGSNAHLILEDYPRPQSRGDIATGPQVFVLSAKNRASLRAYAQRMLRHLDADTDAALADIAYTSQVGRTPMVERLALIAHDRGQLRERLRQWLEASANATSPRPLIAEVFEGNQRDAQASAGLIEGEAGAAYLRATLAQRDLARLARLWICGVDIDWAALHAPGQARRVSLPSYPFEKARYWIDTASLPGADDGRIVPAAPAMPAPERLHYHWQWQARELDAVVATADIGAMLVLDQAGELATRLTQRLGDGAVVRAVGAGAYKRVDETMYEVDADGEDGFAPLLAALREASGLPRTIVCVGSGEDAGFQAVDRDLIVLHRLAQALIAARPERTIRVVCVRRAGDDAANARHLALSAYLKTLSMEHPRLEGKLIVEAGGAAETDIAARVLAELGDEAWREREVRYRPEGQGEAAAIRRQSRRLVALTPPAQAASQPAIKQRGVYWITGGLGGLGYLLAEHLAQRYRARLVLTGRSAFEPAHAERLARLRALGGEAHYLQADTADESGMRAAVDAVRSLHGRIDGVIHAAGIHRDGFVLNKSRADIEAVLAAKVRGTLLLDRALADEPLDLFVLFSSIAGVLGNPGQSDYAYANGFLDAFAEQRQARVAAGERHGRTVSMAWPFWLDGGMRLSDSDIELARRRSGLEPLPAALGWDYWDEFLAGGHSHGLALYGQAAQIRDLLRPRPQSDAPVPREPASSRGDASLLDAVHAYLKRLLSEQIKLPAERIDTRERFESYGVDSMMINRINAELERDLGELPKTLFYEYACIDELAGYLLREAGAALARRLAPDAATMLRTDEAVAAPAVAAYRQAPVARTAAPIEPGERIAIIGVHGQFPQSPDVHAYWNHLAQGRDLTGPVPRSRWDADAFYDADPEQAANGKIYCKTGGFIDDFDRFDAGFFNVPAADARMIDPQERLFLQSVWSAIEDAGYTRERLRQRHPKGRSADVGVFAGVTTNSYHLLAPEQWARGNLVTPGAMPWSIANRVSYFFDFQGPSMPVDTACSSSLVAIHLACESLQRGECQVAVAGGVNLYLHPSKYQSFCKRRMLATQGQCRSFGAGDDGFIPGEGVGALVLKPLSRALADGDRVLAVIAASASEHSGRSNGYSAPNPAAQASLIERTLAQAGVRAESIGYVEGHGTGTQLGDNLEVVSLTQAFAKHTDRKQFCSLGSVKANVGHSESAAGISGVAKILMQFQHGQIAPSLHCEQANPNIDFADSPFYLQRELSPWPRRDGQPRRALINSFGAGGVNACMILEEPAASAAAVANDDRAHLIVVSARNAERLRANALRLKDYLRGHGDGELSRVAYTLQCGREAMEQRVAWIARDRAGLLAGLDAVIAGDDSALPFAGRVEAHQRKKAPSPQQREQHRALHQAGDLDALARLWIDGHSLAWEDFHGEPAPTALPLPGYAFAKDRYWVCEDEIASTPAVFATTAAPSAAPLHPLLSHNASTLKDVCFASTLSGEAYYGRDHQVNGERFFPGAGFVEIACIAGTLAGERSVSRIEDIVWVQPLKLTPRPTTLKTYLRESGNGTDCVVVSFDHDNERVVHCEARLQFGAPPAHGGERPPPLALEAIKRRAGLHLRGEHCYARMRQFGFSYGRSFRSIEELHTGEGFALARLRLADELEAQFDQYLLHPCLIDAALQTVIGVAGEADADTPYLPFALGSIECLRPLTRRCYAYAEPSAGGHAQQGDVRQFDIRLLSESGEVLVKLNRFYVRALRGAASVSGDAGAVAMERS